MQVKRHLESWMTWKQYLMRADSERADSAQITESGLVDPVFCVLPRTPGWDSEAEVRPTPADGWLDPTLRLILAFIH
jgi:hypothetical protein